MKPSDSDIIIKETYKANVIQVWNALTHLKEMKQWYFDNIPKFEPKVGFKTAFLIQNEGRNFTHQWKITEVIPNKKIAYEWTFKEYPGRSITLFELFQQDGQTTLKLTCKTLEHHPTNIPEFKRESGIAGWNYFLGERLKNFLNK